MEEAAAQEIPLFVTFIDFMKAFDSIDGKIMFAILRHNGIPEKIVAAIRVLYLKSTSQVYVDGELSEEFQITTGVLQGYVLVPVIVIDYISTLSKGSFGYRTHKVRTNTRACRNNFDGVLNDLAFADDIARRVVRKSTTAA